ncbi:hypothetical protein, partial [Raoultella sp. 18086]|uniref:hypothetical protein n=1 Tax=Raoultella sp. 18086 TaxID=2681418 RepID=UPI00190FA455
AMAATPVPSPAVPALASLAAAGILAACGGGSGGDPAGAPGGGATEAGGSGPAAASAPTAEEAARFLLQAQFSASDEEIAAVRTQGYAAWLARQFAQPVGTTGTEWLMQRGYGVANADTRYHNASYPADYM